jgi:chromosome segregation ATPase
MFDPTPSTNMPTRVDSPTPSLEPQRAQGGGLFGNFLRGRTNSGAPSIASIDPSITSIDPTIGDLQKENDTLRKEKETLKSRCEELQDQSTLNQSMFQACSKDLLTKDTEVNELREVATEHERIISDLKDCMRQDTEANEEQVHALKLQMDILATELAESHDMAKKRDTLITKLKEQQQQFVELYAAEQQHSKKQINDIQDAPSEDLEAKLDAKEKTIAFLRHRQYLADKTIDRLRDAEMDWEKTIIAGNKRARARAERAMSLAT